MKSQEQLKRMLRMVPYLSAHPGVEVTTVAETFGITTKQVIRDLEVLQFCGLPGGYYDDLFDVDIDAVREEGHIEFRNADVLKRPLRLRSDEAASLLAALRVVVELTGTSGAASSALKKLEAAVGDAGAHLSVSVAAGDPERRAQLADAVERRSVTELEYRTPGRGGVSTAEVEPMGLRIVDGYTYLDAWSRARDAWRSFRLDRIVAASVLDESFTPRGEPPSSWFEDVARELSLTVTSEARWITEYYPTSEVNDEGDRIRVTFPVASLDWAVGLILRLGNAVLEVSDPQIARLAHERAQGALAGYSGDVR